MSEGLFITLYLIGLVIILIIYILDEIYYSVDKHYDYKSMSRLIARAILVAIIWPILLLIFGGFLVLAMVN